MLGEFWRNVAGRSKRKIVYTAMTAGYDRLLPPAIVDADIDYLVYTDAPAAAIPPPWQARPIRVALRNPRVASRWYKILPHRHLPRAGHSLWIDANYEIVGSLSAVFDRLAATTKFGMARHPERNCAYVEVDVVKGVGLEHPEIVDVQMAHYRRLGYPADHGLTDPACCSARTATGASAPRWKIGGGRSKPSASAISSASISCCGEIRCATRRCRGRREKVRCCATTSMSKASLSRWRRRAAALGLAARRHARRAIAIFPRPAAPRCAVPPGRPRRRRRR